MQSTIATIVQASRPKFVILAPVCVLVGVAAAVYAQAHINVALVMCCFGIATLGHISVNLLNEYHDATSGLDERTEKTPFSGGSGALQDNPSAAKAVKGFGLLSLFALTLLGLYVISQVHVVMSAIGLIGIMVVLTYTPWLNRNPWLCLFAPGLGFGLLMVIGTYAALTGTVDPLIVCISLPVFCLVNNLLLLNQFPDAVVDKSVGRDHFVIRYGYQSAALSYFVLAMLAYISVIISVVASLLPDWSLLSLIGLPISILIAIKAGQFEANNVQAILPFLGLNVLVTLIVPLILAFTLFLA